MWSAHCALCLCSHIYIFVLIHTHSYIDISSSRVRRGGGGENALGGGFKGGEMSHCLPQYTWCKICIFNSVLLRSQNSKAKGVEGGGVRPSGRVKPLTPSAHVCILFSDWLYWMCFLWQFIWLCMFDFEIKNSRRLLSLVFLEWKDIYLEYLLVLS